MKICAAICTYNRERYLPQLFESIKSQSLSTDKFEVVLVNNNSPGNTKEICDDFIAANPSIEFRHYEEFNQGLSFARNRCITECKAETITFLDDDAFIAEDYLEVVLNYFKNHSEVAAVGSKIHLHYETLVPKWENRFINEILGYYDLGEEEKNFSPPAYPRGSNMSFKMEVFEKVGQFNVKLGRIGKQMLGGEEKEFFGRIYSDDSLIVRYIPNAMVYHCVPIERTTDDFVRVQATGIGRSERLRSQQYGFNSVLISRSKEILKWGASFIISLYYLFTAKFSRAAMILKFRAWVSIGMFFNK